MARQRTVKPEFFKDKRMASLGAQVALVYLALWQVADDGGVARIEPDLLHGEVFSRWGEFTQSAIIECLVRLAGAGRIKPYVVGDELYAEIPTLIEHQQIQRPSKFRYPRRGRPVSDLRGHFMGQFLIEPSQPYSSSVACSVSDSKALALCADAPEAKDEADAGEIQDALAEFRAMKDQIARSA